MSTYYKYPASGTGTVTSIAIAVPAILTVSGSPVTTSGTITIGLATETANTVFAGPTSGGAATPTFRALVAADLPAGAVLSVGAFGSTPSANAASISANVLTLQPADATHPGGISLSAQTLGDGLKTLLSGLVVQNGGFKIIDTPNARFNNTLGDIIIAINDRQLWNSPSSIAADFSTADLQVNHGLRLLGFDGANQVTVRATQSLTGSVAYSLELPQNQGSAGQYLVNTAGDGIFNWATPATGSVTSVALSVPAFLSVAGSPITTSGTLAITLATETANTVFAGPTSGGAATPTFRALVTADLPAGVGTVTSVAASVPAFLSIAGSPITTSGTLAITLSGTALPAANGGTGTTAPQTFQAFTNLGLSASVSANALTIALKQSDGSTDPSSTAPVQIPFRNVTLTSGLFNVRSVTGALSIVIPSGTTIGTINSNEADIYVYAIDNGGTVVLAVSAWGLFDEGTTQGSTSIAGQSTQQVLYATTGLSVKPIRLIGRVIVSNGGAGTWSVAPSEVDTYPFRTPQPYVSATDLLDIAVDTSASSGTLTVTTDLAVGGGSSGIKPSYITFRSTTANDGTSSRITSASSGTVVFQINSTTTLGMRASQVNNLYVYAMNNSGVVQYAASTIKYDDSVVQSAVASKFTFTVTIASPAVVSATAHGLLNGDAVTLSTNGALPTGLVSATKYYVVGKSANAFNLALTPGGAAINTSGSQSGTQTCRLACGRIVSDAVYTNLPTRLIGYSIFNLATSGTWIAPTTQASGHVLRQDISCRYTNTSALSIPAATLTTVSGHTISYDTVAMFDTVSGTAVIPIAGKYTVTAANRMTNSGVALSNLQKIAILNNGSIVSLVDGPLFNNTMFISDVLTCAQNDLITIQLYSDDAAAALNTVGTQNYITIERVDG